MGIYAGYLNQNLDGNQLVQERKRQLKRISELRDGRAILVFASALTKARTPITIDYDDIVPINDQLTNLTGDKIDVILETPGGYAEIAEQIIEYIRVKFNDVAFIIPGAAMSAGTIMAMAGDDILMSPLSSLGPIDAQISQQGKRFSADAFLEGLNKIKEEVTDTGVLNKAYIPILQNVSPGEIQSAQNALEFSRVLVTGWLSKYKFKNWHTHSTSGKPVTEEDKKKRAGEIAKQLCNHSVWKTHGRSITLKHLRDMKLKITDYTENKDLSDAIQRYFTLLKIFFDSTNIFKIYETHSSQIYRNIPIQGVPQQELPTQDISQAEVGIQCPQCKNEIKLQANFKDNIPLKPGLTKMPKEDMIECPNCKKDIDLVNLKKTIEGQVRRKIVYGN